jgi:hypothetical protein
MNNKITFAALAFFIISSECNAQKAEPTFDQLAPDFKVETSSLSFYEGKCFANLLTYSNIYPDVYQSHITSDFSKADFAWLNKTIDRADNLEKKTVAKNPNLKLTDHLKKLSKSDAEFLYGSQALLLLYHKSPPSEGELNLSTLGACGRAKLQKFKAYEK